MKYRDLNASPRRTLAEIVGSLSERATTGNTGAYGIKHMGQDGDTLFTTPDGLEKSMRDLDAILDITREELAEAIRELEELNNVTLPELWEKLEGLEELEDVQAILDELDRLDTEVKEAGRLYTAGPPPSDPVVGSTLWVAPNGRVFRAIDCEE